MNKINIFNLLFLFSIFCLLFSISASEVGAVGASLFLSPASESFRLGETFSADLKVDTAGIPINAAGAVIYFPSNKLEVISLLKENSIFTIWPEEPAFSNSEGKISFVGGIPHPGFAGTGNIITINFRAKQEKVAQLVLYEGKVLADDGKGTDVLIFIREARYYIQEEVSLPLFSPTHPQPEEWYNNNNPRFQWELTPDIIGVSFVLDQNPQTLPDAASEGMVQAAEFKKIGDGMWYFHLRAVNEGGWSEPTHYKIQIDSLPPRPFEVIIDNEGDPTNPAPNLYFETSDEVSGINYYKLRIREGDFLNLMTAEINPFRLPIMAPGRHQLLVRAADKAGNNAETKTVIEIEPIESPEITIWPRVFVSGEEKFYIEGTAPPETEITIFLEKDDKVLKKWLAFSNEGGEWSFFTKELIKSGSYSLSAQAKDKRGAESLVSQVRQIEVSLSGISLGNLLISFRTLVLLLSLILFSVVIVAGLFIYKVRRAKRTLKKETQEVKESLHQAFESLSREIEKRIETFDSRPGFNEKERKICDELKKALEIAEASVEKEIKDVEKELE